MCKTGVADRYASRISGPLRDRIDLWVTMPRVRPEALVASIEPEGSATVQWRIAAARDRQYRRSGMLNGTISGRALRAVCGLDRVAERRVVALAELERLSARGVERLLRVARTIADIADQDTVSVECLEEAAHFRSRTGRVAGQLAV